MAEQAGSTAQWPLPAYIGKPLRGDISSMSQNRDWPMDFLRWIESADGDGELVTIRQAAALRSEIERLRAVLVAAENWICCHSGESMGGLIDAVYKARGETKLCQERQP